MKNASEGIQFVLYSSVMNKLDHDPALAVRLTVSTQRVHESREFPQGVYTLDSNVHAVVERTGGLRQRCTVAAITRDFAKIIVEFEDEGQVKHKSVLISDFERINGPVQIDVLPKPEGVISKVQNGFLCAMRGVLGRK